MIVQQRGECIQIMREMKARIRRIDQRLEEIASDDDPFTSPSARRQRRDASNKQKAKLCAEKHLPMKLMIKAHGASTPEIPELECTRYTTNRAR